MRRSFWVQSPARRRPFCFEKKVASSQAPLWLRLLQPPRICILVRSSRQHGSASRAAVEAPPLEPALEAPPLEPPWRLRLSSRRGGSASRAAVEAPPLEPF
ncbi:hypothetical protein EYF80_065222 [Liparis tanakae]|uniref:Uncharacterized protein n=1 Tax=Liparis tanakae TaxID=230148 RepID=A0A4Z2E8M2_9TELE|nr:hypothetical protein EYF80_065222 [Liparis tanakae]